MLFGDDFEIHQEILPWVFEAWSLSSVCLSSGLIGGGVRQWAARNSVWSFPAVGMLFKWSTLDAFGHPIGCGRWWRVDGWMLGIVLAGSKILQLPALSQLTLGMFALCTLQCWLGSAASILAVNVYFALFNWSSIPTDIGATVCCAVDWWSQRCEGLH